MATKRYSQQTFAAILPNGAEYTFICWKTYTRCGFCHTCYCVQTDKTTKVSYYNRTWECYTYQTVLKRAIDKFNKGTQQLLNAWEKSIEQADREKWDKTFAAFQSLYEGLTDKQKEKLAEQPPMQSEEDVERTMAAMTLANVLNIMNDK